MLFVNSVPTHHSRLLYIMGATWHTKCMFDLKTHQPSFAQLLNQQGIETYAVDIFGSGPGVKPDVIGDLYNNTMEYLRQLVDQYKIDCVMGYSAGCAFAVDLTKTHNFRKMIFLDPRANVQVDKQCINNDKYVISKRSVMSALVHNHTAVDAQTAKDHIGALCSGPELVTAAYPIVGQYLKRFNDPLEVKQLLDNNSIKTFFTKQSFEHIRQSFGDNCVYWPQASHWILLEPYRKDLADEVGKFLKHE